jgi:hypothetical protein
LRPALTVAMLKSLQHLDQISERRDRMGNQMRSDNLAHRFAGLGYSSEFVQQNIETQAQAQQGWFDDPQGRILGMHWLEGSGEDLILNDEVWGDYMRANQHLNNILMEIIDNDLLTRKKSGGFSRTIFAETGFNDRRTGYGILHGTQNFNILMSVTVINDTRLSYSATLTWNDRINPNANQGDSLWVTAANLFWTPRDYDVRIIWFQNFNVERK